MQLFKKLADSIAKYDKRNAFYINDVYHTYHDLAEKISGIRHLIRQGVGESEKNIGLVANDDLETYAAIVAIWFEGKSYVPISPQMPVGRNEEMMRQAGIRTVIDSSEDILFSDFSIIKSGEAFTSSINLVPETVASNELSYILFTSGSTGTSKGVPITIDNLSSFVNSFFLLGFDLDENDKWLQMFELTFDLSIMSYLIPLLKGACVYTIPRNQIKYNYVFKLLDEQGLTIALMVPTVLQYLRPYFDEISCHSLRYNLFCGEALPMDITDEWSHCVPNAKIFNVYGPSEATIFCTHYLFKSGLNNKAQNGILSIGKPMNGTKIIIVDEENNPLSCGKTGELCLSGGQVTPGYLNDDEKNSYSFFNTEYDGRFYKTGDLCIAGDDGDIMYIGRMDSQVKIHGYRVELSEVEFMLNHIYLQKM